MFASLILFIVMGCDKSAAKAGKRRVPERILFMLAALGGALGGILGMGMFHHKTKKCAFVIGMPLLLVLNAAVVLGAAYLIEYFNMF